MEHVVVEVLGVIELPQRLEKVIGSLSQIVLGHDRVTHEPCQFLQLDGLSAGCSSPPSKHSSFIEAAHKLVEVHGVVEIWNVI